MADELAPETTLYERLSSEKLMKQDLNYTLYQSKAQQKEESPKHIYMSYSDLKANPHSAKYLAHKLLFEAGITDELLELKPMLNHDVFRLQAKIIWCREVVDIPSLGQAMLGWIDIRYMIE